MARPRDVRGADADDDALVYVNLRTTPVNGSSPRQNWMVFAVQNDENVWKVTVFDNSSVGKRISVPDSTARSAS
jgi:hypothetical protein